LPAQAQHACYAADKKSLQKLQLKAPAETSSWKSAQYFSAELIKAFHSLPLRTANVEAEVRDYLWFVSVEH